MAEKLYEVQAPLRAAQAEEEARLQKLEAEEEQRKTPPELMPRHGCAWARLGSTVVVMQSMLVDGVFEGSDKTEDWPAHRPDPDHEDGAPPRSCEGQARGG